jgi:rod shape-determining protein MreC
MRWFVRHRFLTLIIAILAVLVLLTLVSYRLQGDDTAVGRAAKTVVSFVQKPVSALGDRLSDAFGGAGRDKALLEENERLAGEVETLKSQLQEARLNTEEYEELKALSETFNVANPPQDMKAVAANVISFDNTDAFNVFTIDAGEESGVERNAVVVCGDGLVGRVLSAGKGWSKVVSVIDENNKIGFQVTEEQEGKTKDFLGICAGDGEGNLTGRLLDESGFAKEGDIVMTSGLGGIYPAGIVIGTVTTAEFTERSQLMTVVVEPAVYYKGLKKVAVLV